MSTNVPASGFVHHPVEDLVTYVGYDRLVLDTVPNYKLVDPRETTVTFADGGNFGPISNELGSVSSELYVYNHSHINVDGGSIDGILGLDDSTLNVVRGSVTQVDAHKESQVELQSAGAVQSVRLFGKSKLLANGAQINSLNVSDNTSALLYDVDLEGGSVTTNGAASVEISGLSDIATLIASDSSHAQLTDAKVGNVSAADDSRVGISGGRSWGPIVQVQVGDRAALQLLDSDAQDLLVIQSGKAELVGATVNKLRALGSVVVNSNVSQIDSLVARGDATVSLSRGSTDRVEIFDSSTLNLSDVFVNEHVNVNGGTVDAYQGQIDGSIFIEGNVPSTVTLRDLKHIVGEVSVSEPQSKLRITGNTLITGDVIATNRSEMNLAGGSVPSIYSLDESVVEFSNTIVRNAGIAADGGKLFMYSGHVTNDLTAIGPGSTVVLVNGAVDRNLVGVGGAVVTMSGGFVAGKAYIDAASTFNFSGGTIVGDQFQYVPQDDGGEEAQQANRSRCNC